MSVDRLLGVALIAIGTLGIVTTPVRQPPAVHPTPKVPVVVAVQDLPLGTVLLGSDPHLLGSVNSRLVVPADVQPNALGDMHTGQAIRLLADTKAGQQLTSYSVDEPPPSY